MMVYFANYFANDSDRKLLPPALCFLLVEDHQPYPGNPVIP